MMVVCVDMVLCGLIVQGLGFSDKGLEPRPQPIAPHHNPKTYDLQTA